MKRVPVRLDTYMTVLSSASIHLLAIWNALGRQESTSIVKLKPPHHSRESRAKKAVSTLLTSGCPILSRLNTGGHGRCTIFEMVVTEARLWYPASMPASGCLCKRYGFPAPTVPHARITDRENVARIGNVLAIKLHPDVCSAVPREIDII